MPGENCAPGRFENPLLGHVCLANGVIQLGGFGLVPFGEQPFRTQDAALRHRRASPDRRDGQGFLQRLGRRVATDAAQGHRSGGGHFRIGRFQLACQRVHRLGIAPNAD